MSRMVDERIVEMSFDNKNFEKNVKTTMDTIDKLKSSLNFSGVSSSIQDNLNSIDTSALTKGLSSVSKGFSTLEIMAIAAIARITSRVVDLGIQMAKSLSTDQIAAGWGQFKEYAVSEATLLAQGIDQADVTQTLENLLWFTDETSYSFVDMLNNMSKFTAAGIELEVAEKAMMGIANWAALSGQNAQTASHVMYQLSQAMGSGVIKLQDWKSIETANMATKEFKDMILETAVSMGTLTKNIDGTFNTLTGKTFDGNQFRDFLTEGFLTSDVLTASLEQYSATATVIQKMMEDDSSLTTASKALKAYEKQIDELEASYGELITETQKAEIAQLRFGIKAFKAAQEARTFTDAIQSVKDAVSTGWMRIFSNIFGPIEEAKVLWTDLANELYDFFMDGLWSKIDLLESWADMGGRSDLFINTEEETGAFWNLFYAISEIKKLISGAWQAIFPPKTAEDLKNFTARLKEITANLRLSYEAGEVLTKIFKGLFSVIKLFVNIIKALWTGIQPVVIAIKNLAGALLYFLGEAGEGFSKFISSTTIFEKIGKNISGVLQIVVDRIKDLNIIPTIIKMVNAFSEAFNKARGTGEGTVTVFGALKKALDWVLKALLSVYDFVVKYIGPALSWLLINVAKITGSLFGNLGSVFSWIKNITGDFITFVKTSKILSTTLDFIKKAFENFVVSMKKFFGSFKKVNTSEIDEFNEEVVNKLTPLQVVLEGLASFFSGIWAVIKSILPALSKALQFIGNAFKTFGEKLKTLFSGETNWKEILSLAFLTTVVISIIKVINMFKGITRAIEDVFGGMAKSLYADAMIKYAQALKTIAVSVLILVAALMLISTMDPDKLAKSIIVLGTILGFFVTIIAILGKLINAGQTMSLSFKNFNIGLQALVTAQAISMLGNAMIKMAVAVLLLAVAMKLIGTIETGKILKGFLVIIGLVGMFVAVAIVIKKQQGILNKGLRGIVSMAIAIWLLVGPIKKLGEIETEQLVRGMASIGLVFYFFSSLIKQSKSVEKAGQMGFMMGMLAHAILVTSLSIIILGLLPIKVLLKGLTTVNLITGLFILLGYMQKYMKDTLKTAQSMVLIAAALLIMTGPLLILGLMPWNKMLVGLGYLLGIVSIYILLGYTQKKLRKTIKTAQSLLLISTALVIMTAPMVILSLMPWNKMLVGLGYLLGIVSTVILLGYMQRFMRKTITTVKSLLLISAALVIMTAPMVILSLMPWNKMLVGIGAILSLVGTLILLGYMQKYMKNTIKTAKSMMLVAVALAIMTVPLLAIGILGPFALLGALVMLALAGIFILLGKQQKKMKSTIKTAQSMILVAVALNLMALPLIILGLIPWQKLIVALSAILGIVGIFILLGYMQRFMSDTTKTIKSMMRIAVALGMLVLPLFIIGMMSWESIAKGLVALTGIILAFVALGVLERYMQSSIKTAVAMMLVASSLIIASIPLLILGSLEWPTIWKGVVGMSVIAMSMTALGYMGSKLKGALSTATAIILISASLVVASIPLVILGFLDWNTIIRGGVGMIAIAVVLGGLAFIGGKIQNSLKTAGMIAIIAFALLIASIPLITLGQLPWWQVLQGALGLLAIVGIMWLIATLFKPAMAIGILLFAASLIAVSVGLTIFANSLEAIVKMNFGGIGKQMLILGAALLGLTAIAALFTLLSPILLIGASVMLIFGAALFLTVTAITMFLDLLIRFNAELLLRLKGAIAIIVEVAPLMATAISALLNIIFVVLRAAIVEMFITLGVLVDQILSFIYTYGPMLIEGIMFLLVTLLQKLDEQFGLIAESIINMLVTLLQKIRDRIGEIVEVLADIFVNILNALTEKLPLIIKAFVDLIVALVEALGKELPRITGAFLQFFIDLFGGVAQQIRNKAKKVIDAFWDLLDAIAEAFGYAIGSAPAKMVSIGKNLVDGIIEGFKGGLKDLRDTSTGMMWHVWNWLCNKMGIQSPSTVFAEIGLNLSLGIAKGLDDGSKKVLLSAESVGDDVIEGLDNSGIASAIQKINDNMATDMNSEFVIRPVMDITDIQNGANAIFGLMDNADGFNINGSADIATKTATGLKRNQKEKINTTPKQTGFNATESPSIFNNTFNITGVANPKEAAKEISEILQTQINRSKAAYGKSGI